MAAILEELKTAAMKLTLDERDELIDYLTELPGSSREDATRQAEIRRRFEELRSGKDPGVPLDQLFAKPAE